MAAKALGDVRLIRVFGWIGFRREKNVQIGGATGANLGIGFRSHADLMQPKFFSGLGAAILTVLAVAGSLTGGAAGSSGLEDASHPETAGPDIVERFRIEGRLGCAIGTMSSSSDLCGEGDEALAHPGLSDPIRKASYSLRWTPTHPALGAKLSLAFMVPRTENYDAQAMGELDLVAHTVRGASPIGVRFEATTDDDPLYLFNPGGTLATNVRASYMRAMDVASDPSSVDHVGIIVDQPYVLCVTLAYNQAPLPEEEC